MTRGKDIVSEHHRFWRTGTEYDTLYWYVQYAYKYNVLQYVLRVSVFRVQHVVLCIQGHSPHDALAKFTCLPVDSTTATRVLYHVEPGTDTNTRRMHTVYAYIIIIHVHTPCTASTVRRISTYVCTSG